MRADRRSSVPWRAATGLLLAFASAPAAAALGYGPERRCRDALPERLHLQVADKHHERLERQRGALSRDRTDARIQVKPIPITLGAAGSPARPRGKLTLFGESPGAPELRLSLSKSTPAFGMFEFQLRRPPVSEGEARKNLFAKLCREGILSPRTAILPVSLDGDPLGSMLLIETPAKELLEHQHRRDGVLFRVERAAGLPGAAQLVPLGRMAVLRSDEMSIQFDVARALLRGFLQKRLSASAVFDVDLMARFLAIAASADAAALLLEPNLRFYFNPVTQRIEPVAFDGEHTAAPAPQLETPKRGWFEQSSWAARLLEDDLLRTATDSHVSRIAAGGSIHAGSEAFDPDEALPPTGVPPLPRPIPEASRAEALALHPFLQWNAERRTFTVRPGVWKVQTSLILPAGAGLEISRGTTLRFAEHAMLAASGPLRFNGSAQQPIILEGYPSQFGPRGWQGVVVLRSTEPHHWSWVRVRNTQGISHQNWHLTGGVTIRDSSVRIEDSSFDGNRAEDALNLIRSEFTLVRVSIRDTASDALDTDFCAGQIQGGHFQGIGGDGIDVSGSRIEIRDVTLKDVHDKAISIGEGSHLDAVAVSIRNAGTGVASKDASLALIRESTLRQIRHVALMAFAKKPEYGPAAIQSWDLRLADVSQTAVAQLGSRIEINGTSVEASRLDTLDLYRTGSMRK